MLLLFFCTLWLNGIPSYQFTKVFCLLKNIIGWFPNILGKFFFTFKMCVYSLFLRCLQLPYSSTFHYPTRDASLFWWASLNRSSLLNYLLFQYFFMSMCSCLQFRGLFLKFTQSWTNFLESLLLTECRGATIGGEEVSLALFLKIEKVSWLLRGKMSWLSSLMG